MTLDISMRGFKNVSFFALGQIRYQRQLFCRRVGTKFLDTDDGRSSLDVANAYGHADMVQHLLSAGATQ